MATKRSIPAKTAAEALAIRATQADELLVSIRTQVEEMITKNRDTTDWGYVGDLSRVVSGLREVNAFLQGADINEDPEAA